MLLECVPGLAKTLAVLDPRPAPCAADFSRIQCTPDLLPSDIIGTQVYDPRRHVFETQLGPVHANFVLLDEINRASAKTQSAMLEAMQERQTSIAGEVHPLPSPFLVLATQNPIEEEGTYVLPEAQMDRFLLKEIVDYPTRRRRVRVLDRIDDGTLGAARRCRRRRRPRRRAALQAVVSRIYVDASIKRYIVGSCRRPGRPRGCSAPSSAATSRSAPAPAARSRSSRWPGRWPSSRVATTSSPRTSASCATACCVTGSTSPSRRWPTGIRPEDDRRRGLRRRPQPLTGRPDHGQPDLPGRSRLVIHAHRKVRGLLDGEYASLLAWPQHRVQRPARVRPRRRRQGPGLEGLRPHPVPRWSSGTPRSASTPCCWSSAPAAAWPR